MESGRTKPNTMERMNISRDVAERAVPKVYECFAAYADLIRLLKSEMPDEDLKKVMDILGDAYTPMDEFLKRIFDRYPDLADRVNW